MSSRIAKALAVTAELTGTDLTPAAARVMVQDLTEWPEEQVLAALRRCRRELKGRLTLAAILERIDDGRPSPDEAWAMVPRDEAASVVWSDEMAEAWGVARPLIDAGDLVAARVAFIEAYRKAVQAARDAGRPVRWRPSLGTDPRGREAAVREAVERGRLSAERARAILPPPVESERMGQMTPVAQLTSPADARKRG